MTPCDLRTYLCPSTTEDALEEPPLAFGYYIWKLRSRTTLSADFWRLAVALLLIVALAGVELVIMWNGLRDEHYEDPVAKCAVFIFVLVIPALGGYGQYLYLRRIIAREQGHILTRRRSRIPGGPLEEEGVRELISADSKERNQDFRFLANYYVHINLWALAAIGPLVALWLRNRDRGWFLLLLPPLALCAVFAQVFVYRRVKRLKRYLENVEKNLDAWVARAARRSARVQRVAKARATRTFWVGFFQFVRKRHFQETPTIRLPGYLTLITAMMALAAAVPIAAFLGCCHSMGIRIVDRAVWEALLGGSERVLLGYWVSCSHFVVVCPGDLRFVRSARTRS